MFPIDSPKSIHREVLDKPTVLEHIADSLFGHHKQEPQAASVSQTNPQTEAGRVEQPESSRIEEKSKTQEVSTVICSSPFIRLRQRDRILRSAER